VYPGTVLLVLAMVGTLDRLRGRRAREARLVYLIAALAVFWTVTVGIPVPLLGRPLPSPMPILHRVVPALETLRGLRAVRLGAYLALAVLAGHGVRALVERRGPITRRAITLALVVAALLEVFYGPVARRSFGTSEKLKAYAVRPPDDLLGLYDRIDAGAVLDLPFSTTSLRGGMHDQPYFVLLGAFHGRPVAACASPTDTPVTKDVETLAGALPDPRAADALHALGFRTVVLHDELVPPDRRGDFQRRVDAMPLRERRLERLGEAATDIVYRLGGSNAPPLGLDALVPDARRAMAVAAAPEGAVAFAFRNGADRVYRHPDPIAPTPLVVRWYARGGALVGEHAVRALLPLALAPGATTVRDVIVPLPAPEATYAATLATAAVPARVLARAIVTVGP